MHPFNRAQERALSASLYRMIQTVTDQKDTVLELPYTIKPSNSPSVEIKVTDRHKFAPFPEADLVVLEEAYKERRRSFDAQCWPQIFQAPRLHTQFSWWAARVTRACRALSKEKELWKDDKTKEQYAGYSGQDTNFGNALLTQFILGESRASACGVRWHVTAFLETASFDYGAILATHPMKTLDLSPTRILRSELLTLLALLRTASRRAVQAGTPCISPTVFLLSFAYDQLWKRGTKHTGNYVLGLCSRKSTTIMATLQVCRSGRLDRSGRRVPRRTAFSTMSTVTIDRPTVRLRRIVMRRTSRTSRVRYTWFSEILIQSPLGLRYLHELIPYTIHRGIKPGNILVARRSLDRIIIKLADFGLTKAADELGTTCSTLMYMEPEIHRKNLHSLGWWLASMR
ncbi:hypothetical protein EV127DRAFT_443349 [Xylaria flabelliformis]|nr:hypothetical protein EV127DRAFT_443349 [Xylaria flabelliformis]